MLGEIQGADIGSELDFHRAVAGALDLGPYHGRNLSALWDALSANVERPVCLIWRDADISRRRLGDDLFDRIRDILDRVVEQDRSSGWVERFEYELR
ncbi:barstar family protein [Actinoplanes sp. NPDC000266]